MALRIAVLAGPEAGSLALTLDAPRLVIGRSEGCEIRLPDPSVSARHASLRQRGADWVVVDEGSDNGTFLGRERLSPRTPTVVRSGDRVRVGRVWLVIHVEPAHVKSATQADAKEMALALVARGLAAQGEDPTPRVVVVEGPDQGRALRLEEPGRPYVIGRGKDTDLPLEDEGVSRRHLSVARRGDGFLARDLGSRAGAVLDGAPLPQADTPWRPGQILALGATRLACEHPAAEALAELERSPTEAIRPGELLDPPDAGGGDPDATPTTSPAEDETPAPAPRLPSAPIAPAPAGGWGLADAAVVLLAIGVLALSVAGLAWLLGRG